MPKIKAPTRQGKRRQKNKVERANRKEAAMTEVKNKDLDAAFRGEDQPKRSISEILQSSPKVGEKPEVEETEAPAETGEPVEPEVEETEDESTEETEDEAEAQVYDLSDASAKVKIGDKEMTAGEFKRLLDMRDAIENGNRKLNDEFRANAYLRSLDEGTYNRVMAQLVGLAQGKEGIERAEAKAVKLKINHRVEHDDLVDPLDLELPLDITPDSPQYKELQKQFFDQFMEQYAPEFASVADLTKKLEHERSQRVAEQRSVTEQTLGDFINRAGIPISTKGNLIDTLEAIAHSGPDHPHYWHFEKLRTAADKSEMLGIPFEAAWESLGFGKVGGKRTKSQTSAQQTKAPQRTKGGRNAQTRTNDRMSNAMATLKSERESLRKIGLI